MPTRSTVPPLLWEPAPPAIETQSASAQGATDLAETALWRYHLRYWHEHQAQDEVVITVSFNSVPSSDVAVAADGAPGGVDCRLTVQLDFGDDGESIEALRLTREPDEAMPAGRWPCVDHRTSDGAISDLGNGVGEGGERTYAFDPPVPYGSSQRIGLTWDGLDVAGLQNARASLVAVRNRGLRDPDPGVETLVYRTANVQAPTLVMPHNRWSDAIDISALGDTVQVALDAAFTTLFGKHRIGQRIAIKLSYGYSLPPDTGSDTATMAHLPVALSQTQPITAQTSAQVAEALSAWRAANDPPRARGEWVISLAQFAQIDTAAALPLLELDRLVYRLR
jgi:hypothetical protein